MKNAIITGGTGFIGKRLVKTLLDNNIPVILLVRNKSGLSIENSSMIRIIEYNPMDFETVEIKDIPERAVFYHLGWGGVDKTDKNNIDLQLKNIVSSVKAMQFSERIKCSKFVVSGTVAEYVFSRNAIDINEKQSPNDIYGACKVAAHYILDVLAKQCGNNFIWTVLPSTYGEGRNNDNIITYTVKTLLRGEKPLYGNLNQMWDFLYVDEVARALYLIGEYGIKGKTYGVGSGKYMPLRRYIETVRDLINPQLKLGIGEMADYDNTTLSSCVDIDELVHDTGFIPEVDFETGIKYTIDYYAKQKSEEDINESSDFSRRVGNPNQ